jgi:hypothetical protein
MVHIWFIYRSYKVDGLQARQREGIKRKPNADISRFFILDAIIPLLLEGIFHYYWNKIVYSSIIIL